MNESKQVTEPEEMKLEDFIKMHPAWTQGRMAAWTTYFQDALRSYEHARAVYREGRDHHRVNPPNVMAAIETMSSLPKTLWRDVERSVRDTNLCMVFDAHRLFQRIDHGGTASQIELVLLAAQLLQVLDWASRRTTDAQRVWDHTLRQYLPEGTHMVLGYGPPVRDWCVFPGTGEIQTPGAQYITQDLSARAAGVSVVAATPGAAMTNRATLFLGMTCGGPGCGERLNVAARVEDLMHMADVARTLVPLIQDEWTRVAANGRETWLCRMCVAHREAWRPLLDKHPSAVFTADTAVDESRSASTDPAPNSEETE